MRCPYCVSDIPEESLVCAVCRRDLYLFRPLLNKISGIEKQLRDSPDVKQLQGRLATLEQQHLQERVAVLEQEQLQDRVTALESVQQENSVPSIPVTPAVPILATDPEAEPPAPVSPARKLIMSFLLLWVLPVVLLMLAHLLIVVMYDLQLLVLRLVSLLLPLPFGAAWAVRGASQGRTQPWLAAACAAFIAITAVLAMSWTTSRVDGVPVLPANLREWREFIEYAASIALSFTTGILIAGLIRRAAGRSVDVAPLAARAALLMSRGQGAAKTVQALANRLTALAGTLTAAATSVAAAYTGLRAVMGGG